MIGIEKKMARTARRAGLLSGGLLLCLVGAGFLTLAGWLALAPLVGVQMTAAILAGIYLGIGLIMIGIGFGAPSKASARSETTTNAAATDNSPPIIQAFMYGLQAGAQAEQTRRRPAPPTA